MGLRVNVSDYMSVSDPALPELGTVCSSQAMRSVFNSRILPRVRPNEIAVRIDVESVYYTPQRNVVVLYEVHTSNSAGGDSYLAAGTFGRSGSSTGVGPGDGTVELPEHHGFVEIFPHDSQLPSLQWALRPPEMAPELLALGLTDVAQEVFDNGASAEVLRYRPNRRCTLRYSSRSPSGTLSNDLIGKVYRSGKRSRLAWETHEALRAESRGTGVRFPTPLMLVEERSFVLMESVPGTPVRELAIHGPADVAEGLIHQSARTLRDLHRLNVAGGRPSSLHVKFSDVKKQISALEAVLPQFAKQADCVADEISAALLRSAPGTEGLVHGDYTPSQLISGPDGLTLVDFDRFGPGDPAIDVGRFMAALVKVAVLWDRRHLHDQAAAFFDAYGSADAGFRRRAQLMQSIDLAKIGIRLRRDHRSESGPADPVQSADQFLEEALSCLHQPS